MSPIFAQVTAPVEIAAWLVAAFAVAGGLNQVLKLVDRMKDKPPAGEVRAEAAEKFALRADCAAHMAKHEDVHKELFSKIGGVERGANQRLSEEVRGIHVRLNAFEKSIGGLEKATELQNQTLAQMTAQLQRMAERQNH